MKWIWVGRRVYLQVLLGPTPSKKVGLAEGGVGLGCVSHKDISPSYGELWSWGDLRVVSS